MNEFMYRMQSKMRHISEGLDLGWADLDIPR